MRKMAGSREDAGQRPVERHRRLEIAAEGLFDDHARSLGGAAAAEPLDDGGEHAGRNGEIMEWPLAPVERRAQLLEGGGVAIVAVDIAHQADQPRQNVLVAGAGAADGVARMIAAGRRASSPISPRRRPARRACRVCTWRRAPGRSSCARDRRSRRTAPRRRIAPRRSSVRLVRPTYPVDCARSFAGRLLDVAAEFVTHGGQAAGRRNRLRRAR